MAVNGGPCRHVLASGARVYTRMRRWADVGVLDRLFDALQDGRYGYRRIAALLRDAG